jgi:hypothetical protein
LFADEQLWKIPDRLHRALVRREAILLQYASTHQKILEVEISKTPRSNVVRFHGTVYVFDNSGALDLASQAEAASLEIKSSTPVKIGDLVDLTPLLRDRNWKRTRTWAPTEALKSLIKNDLEGRVPPGPILPLKTIKAP